MANYLQNNDSSDDDFNDNLQLAERLRINRENKISNLRKKNFLDEHSSSSSSLEMQSDCHKNCSERAHSAYNKKRQNGDKGIESLANPKRTCLSNRYLKSPESQNKKTRVERYHKPEFPYYFNNVTANHIFADKTYEDHVHNLVEENPAFSSKQTSKKKVLNNLGDRSKDLSTKPIKLSRFVKLPDDQTEQSKNNYSMSSSPQRFHWREPQNNIEEQPRSSANGSIKSAPILSSQHPDFRRDSPSASDGSVVHYVDSASDEDSRSMIKIGSLKGGRQSPDISQDCKKVIGRKVKKKVLDSDLDTEEDLEDWSTKSRSRPLIFSSSDSEVEDERKEVIKSPTVLGSSDPFLFPVNDIGCNKFANQVPANNQSTSYFKDSPIAGPSSSPIAFHAKSPRSFRNRKHSRTNTEISPSNFHSSNVGRTVRGRSRVNVGERYSRRSGSPHPRALPNSHSRMTRSEAAKAAIGRCLAGSQTRRANLNLATNYPDLFDAEDSSEVEFFTANSYSDTETSAESFGGLTISSTVRNPENNGIICEHSINLGSSEDEISVVFSTGPRNGEPRIESQIVRSGEPRRALGRRRQRGSWRQRHEVVSLSPDPVEQVRQVEDDERFARILQAQFDAEVDHDYTPPPQMSTQPRPDVWTPYNTVNPINTLRHSDSDLAQDDDIAMVRSVDWFDSPMPYTTNYWGGTRTGLNRPSIRYAPPSYYGNLLYNNRRLDRNPNRRRRAVSNDTRNLHSFLETLHAVDDLLYSDDSFETFLGIAELNGDVPRGLQKSEINRLPTRQYVAATNGAGSSHELPHKRAGLNKECQVCLSDYENGDTLRILPCFHEFHTPCIDPWLKINHTCPVCRVVVDLEG